MLLKLLLLKLLHEHALFPCGIKVSFASFNKVSSKQEIEECRVGDGHCDVLPPECGVLFSLSTHLGMEL